MNFRILQDVLFLRPTDVQAPIRWGPHPVAVLQDHVKKSLPDLVRYTESTRAKVRGFVCGCVTFRTPKRYVSRLDWDSFWGLCQGISNNTYLFKDTSPRLFNTRQPVKRKATSGSQGKAVSSACLTPEVQTPARRDAILLTGIFELRPSIFLIASLDC